MFENGFAHGGSNAVEGGGGGRGEVEGGGGAGAGRGSGSRICGVERTVEPGDIRVFEPAYEGEHPIGDVKPRFKIETGGKEGAKNAT